MKIISVKSRQEITESPKHERKGFNKNMGMITKNYTKSVLFTFNISSIDACLPLKYSMCYALHDLQGRSDLYRSLFVSVRPYFVILALRATVSVDWDIIACKYDLD